MLSSGSIFLPAFGLLLKMNTSISSSMKAVRVISLPCHHNPHMEHWWFFLKIGVMIITPNVDHINTFIELDNSKLGSTQQWIQSKWHWHVARIISSQKIYGLYSLKHHIVEMRGGVTDAGRTITEDRATQLMEAGGWVSQYHCFGGYLVHSYGLESPDYLIYLKLLVLKTDQSCFLI